MAPPKIRIAIIGASVAGTTALLHLLDKLSSDTHLKYEFIVIEPKTAFECVPTSWSMLSNDANLLSVNLTQQIAAIGSNDLLNPRNTPIPSLYLTNIQSIHKNMSQHFIPFHKAGLLAPSNVHIIHGFVARIYPNHLTISVPEHLQEFIPGVVEDLDATTPSIPIYENKRSVETPAGRHVHLDVSFQVLFDCSGSHSTHPIKTSEIAPNLELFKSAAEHYPAFLDFLKALIELFFSFKLSILSTFDENYHQSLQSLCYLPLDLVKLLIIHYFPQLSDELTGKVASESKNGPDLMPDQHFHTYRALALICFILRMSPATLIDHLVYEDESSAYNSKTHQRKRSSSRNRRRVGASRHQSTGNSSISHSTSLFPSSHSNLSGAQDTSMSFGMDSRKLLPSQGNSLSNLVPDSPPPTFDERLTPIDDSVSSRSVSYSVSTSRVSGNVGSHFGQSPLHATSSATAAPPTLQFPPAQTNQTEGQLFEVVVPTALSSDVLKQLYRLIQDGTITTLPHDSILFRFIEFAAIHATLLFLPEISQNSAPFNDKFKLSSALVTNDEYRAVLPLPPIHRLNFIGGGITSVELIGIYMDVYQNRYNLWKKNEKEREKAKKASKDGNAHPEQFVLQSEAFIKPQVNLFCAFGLLPNHAASMQSKIQKHLTTEFSPITSCVNIHESTMWGVATGLAKQQADLPGLAFRYNEHLSDIGLTTPVPRSSLDSTTQPSFSTLLKENGKWGMLNIFATGMKRSEVIPVYQSTRLMFSNESFEAVKAFITTTNNPDATPEPLRSHNSSRRNVNTSNRQTSSHANLDLDDDYGSSRHSGRLSGHDGALSDVRAFQNGATPHSRRKQQHDSADAGGLSQSIMNLTEGHTKGRTFLKQLPALLFVIGDASIHDNVAYTATMTLKNALIAAENASKYCKHVLEPLILALLSAHQNKVEKGSKSPAAIKDASVAHVVPDDLFGALKKMKDMHTGSHDFTIQLTAHKVFSSSIFGGNSAREHLREKLLQNLRSGKK